jgi:hypothetical protein
MQSGENNRATTKSTKTTKSFLSLRALRGNTFDSLETYGMDKGKNADRCRNSSRLKCWNSHARFKGNPFADEAIASGEKCHGCRFRRLVFGPEFENIGTIAAKHPKLKDDLVWLIGRLAEAPELLGDQVPELGGLAFPIFKTRCKDTCHRIGSSDAWRIYYAVNKPKSKVFLLFLRHKKEYENPGAKFLFQKLERAFSFTST